MEGTDLGELVVRNIDVDWDQWPVQTYLAENYRELHPSDAAVIEHHSAYYRRLSPDDLECSLEFGAGPNLYPLLLAGAASRRIDAVEISRANVAYLRSQVENGPDTSWTAFYQRCRTGNPALPEDIWDVLARIRVFHGDALAVPPGGYDLVSMSFVAEGVTEDAGEFADFCGAFVRAARPGGHLVAAFMENFGRYRLGDGSLWPGFGVDDAAVSEVFEPLTDDLVVCRIEPDPTLPDYGYTGMVMLTGRRRRS